jgi:hypothetical protein
MRYRNSLQSTEHGIPKLPESGVGAGICARASWSNYGVFVSLEYYLF